MKRCKSCWTISDDNAIDCPKCGLSIKDDYTYICNKCGKVFQDDEMVCTKCGKKRVRLSNGRFSTIKEKTTEIKNRLIKIQGKKSKLHNSVIIIFCFLLSFLVSYCYFFYHSNENEGVVIPSANDLKNIEISNVTPLNDIATVWGVDEINLYRKPTINSGVIGVVHRGDKVEILQNQKCTDSTAAILNMRLDYSKEQYSKTGWAELHLKRGAALNIENVHYGLYICSIKDNRDYGFLRLAPNEITRLENTVWYMVKTNNNNTGWLYSGFARIDD